MDHYAGIDVSLATSSVCILDAAGRIIREAKVASEPEALVAFLAGCGHHLARVGLEAGPLSQWLHAGLAQAGLPAVLVETRQVKAALSAMRAKTDRNDARGIAQLIRMGIVNLAGYQACTMTRQYCVDVHAAIWAHVSCRHVRKALARARRY